MIRPFAIRTLQWLFVAAALVAVLGLASAVGCGGGDDDDDDDNDAASDDDDDDNDAGDDDTVEPYTGPTYYQDVKPIMDSRCVSCHTDGGIGPMALDDYEGAERYSLDVANEVRDRAMPPWNADSGYTKYQNNPALTPQQIDTIYQWAHAGAPEGDPDNPGEPIPVVGLELDHVDLTLKLPVDYVPEIKGNETDEYRCFLIDWPYDTVKYVTGFDATPENRNIVHHLAVYLLDSSLPDSTFEEVETWPTIDERPGYSCFGGPSATYEGKDALQVPVQQLAQWVPGNGARVFPQGSGIKVNPGSKIVLQMHYYVEEQYRNESDKTGIDFMLADDVEKLGAYAPFLNVLWPTKPEKMLIPAGATDVRHSTKQDPRWYLGPFVGGAIDLDDGFTIHSGMLHLHLLGRGGTLKLMHEDGTEDYIVEVGHWDFNWQREYVLQDSLEFKDGDKLFLECRYDNDKPGAKDVTWGERSVEEMCVGNMFITAPK
ncbi:hypothetical protein KDL45_10765, partial [bacterium]|nr:hypothetical protein [bacterium]